MRKSVLSICLYIILMMSLLLMYGCDWNSGARGSQSSQTAGTATNPAAQTNTGTQADAAGLKVSDYYPLKENMHYVYAGQGNEFASFDTYVDFINGNRIQTRTDNGGTVTVGVIEVANGELVQLYSRPECYYRENLTENAELGVKREVLLKEPLTVGTSWTLPDKSRRNISNVGMNVDTPSGSYKNVVEVTIEYSDTPDKTLEYYAPGIGLIRSVFKSGTDANFEVSSSLSTIETKAFTQTVPFYFPNVEESKIVHVEKTLTFNTNDLTKVAFENVFKSAQTAPLNRIMSPNAKILSLYLNKDNMVYVDFSKEMVTEMNAGSGYEGMILQSVTDTLGKYYGVQKVVITIEGQPYESGHILKKKGEAFDVTP